VRKAVRGGDLPPEVPLPKSAVGPFSHSGDVERSASSMAKERIARARYAENIYPFLGGGVVVRDYEFGVSPMKTEVMRRYSS